MAALPFIALGLSAAGAGMSVIGQLNQAGFQKNMANRNATIAGQNATAVADRGMSSAAEATMRGSLALSRSRAGAAASGVDVQSGSVLDVLSGTRFMSQYDIEKIGYNTELEKRGYSIQGDNYRAQGDMAERSGAMGAFGTILTATGSAASTAYASGVFPKFGGGGPIAQPTITNYAT